MATPYLRTLQRTVARIIFMGTPEFAVESLKACFQLGDVVAVVTQPDKPRGRGQEVSFSPVKTLALEKNVPVLQPVKIRNTNFAEEIKAFGADVAVVTAYGKILPKDVLETPRLGCLNVHASLLPKWRGAAPIQWALASGDVKTGCCLMKMDEGMDTGPVIARAELAITSKDNAATLHDKLAQLGHQLLLENVGPYLEGDRTLIPQPIDGVTHAPMIKKEDGQLDFTKPAHVLERRLRAFTPWPGCFTTLEGKLLKVHGLTVKSGRGVPGTILEANVYGVEVACGDGSLMLTALQPEGKRTMTAQEFLAGRKLVVGTAPFGAP